LQTSCVARTFGQAGKRSWKGPAGQRRGPREHTGQRRAPREHTEKRLEMKVYPDVDFYILKPEITRK